MDGEAFDRWVAKLGNPARRRAVILGAMSVLVGRKFARGQQRLARQGEPCSSSEQCEQIAACGGSAPVICADNGYADDGPLNCCVGYEQYCGTHAHCCGGLLCLGSHNIDGCGAGRCLPRDTVGEVVAGTACTESAQCSQSDGYAICSEVGICCRFEGSRCWVGIQCCGGLVCVKDDPTESNPYAPGTCRYAG